MSSAVDMDRLLAIMLAVSIALIGTVLLSVRRQHIRVEYSVAWLVAAVVLLVLSLSRSLIHAVTAFLGVGQAPVALLMLIFGIFSVFFYRFSIRLSDLKDSNIALAQRVAILEFHLRSLHEERQARKE